MASAAHERNYGIDLLRIVAMFFVVMLHMMGHGGLLGATEGFKHMTVDLVRTFAFCAVDVFVMISGFCMIESTFKSKRMLSIWAEALFYSLAITAALWLYLDPESVNAMTALTSFTPVMARKWWFLSQYMGLCLLMPLLNKGVMSLSLKQCKILLGVIVGVSLMVLLYGDQFSFERGYSVGWFVFLYAAGGALKRLQSSIRGGFLFWLVIYALICLVAWGVLYLLVYNFSGSRFFSGVANRILVYPSFFVFCSGIALLLAFSRLKVRFAASKKVIAFVSSSAFATYLISDHRAIRNLFITEKMGFLGQQDPLMIVLSLIGMAACVFAICMLIDKVRMALFKVLRIDKAIGMASARIDALVKRS